MARFLKARGIACLVIDPGSLQVNRRGRRVKTDRVDVKMLLRTLIAWCRGERHVWSLVRIPSVDEEDLRRSHRERSRLVRERTAHINRIKGLLFAQGIRDVKVKSQYKTLAVDKLLTADGHRLPPRLASEIARELQRLAMVQEQIAEIERERDTAPTACEATERKRQLLLQLKSIGPAISALLSREVYYRQFANRRQVGSFLGLTPSPYSSGEEERCQGISRAGSGQVRAIMIETAWLGRDSRKSIHSQGRWSAYCRITVGNATGRRNHRGRANAAGSTIRCESHTAGLLSGPVMLDEQGALECTPIFS